jgi:eukaryotic-like serine/threonine-protein kinase
VLKHNPRLPVEDVVEFALQACQALAEAHAAGVVHRDLKPRNLFLSHRSDGTPLVKVLDFGISKWTLSDAGDHSLTKTSDVMGSPNYMSPEQVRSAKEVDGRTDIWSMGVVLFELLTGRVPFIAESLPQLCAMVLEQPAPPLAQIRADVPAGLVQVVARCLAKDPAHRYGSIVELARALEPYGPPRRRGATAMGSTSLSPNASTLAMAGSMLGAPNTGPPYPGPISGASGPVPFSPPPHGSASGASSGAAGAGASSSSSSAVGPISHQVSNGTGVSWGATRFDAAVRRPRVIGVLLAGSLVSLTVFAAFWFGIARWRATGQVPASVDAAPIVTVADAGPAPTIKPSASVASSAPEVASSSPAPTSPPPPATLAGRPPPGRTALAPAVSSVPKPPPPPPPTSDPLTPVDRK